jgi:hypothetical protein
VDIGTGKYRASSKLFRLAQNFDLETVPLQIRSYDTKTLEHLLESKFYFILFYFILL